MGNGFTKLFGSIITSSVWSEDDKVRIMWITMLASADARGQVTGSIPGMAAIARMSLQDAEQSIAALCTPDPYSRTKKREGRRLIETDGGWLIVNYAKYRQWRDPEKRREQNRQAQKRYRERKQTTESKPNVSQSKPKSAQAEAEAEAEAEEKNKRHSFGVSLFDSFWEAYPKKVDKKKSRDAFHKLNVDGKLLETMLSALERQCKTDQWRRGIIPNPTTWLNGARWEDEIPHKETVAEQIERMKKMGDL